MKDEKEKKGGGLFSLVSFLKGKWSFVLLGILGVLLLLFGNMTTKEEEVASLPSADEYRAVLTEEVTALCREVKGVGEVRVLLTLESYEGYAYAEGPSGGVLLSGGKPVLLESYPPRVEGVAVVCRGGGNQAVKEELSALLSASLGIGSHQIKITEKK